MLLEATKTIKLTEQNVYAGARPDLSESENISNCIKTVEYFLQHESGVAPVPLIKVSPHIELNWVELLLALLLGGSELKQTSSFYQLDSLCVFPFSYNDIE